MTRELVYCYFANKRAITEAVLDGCIEDVVESVVVWNESRVFGDTEGSLRKCIAALRRSLCAVGGTSRPIVRALEELGVRDAFGVRIVRETVDCIDAHVVAKYASVRAIAHPTSSGREPLESPSCGKIASNTKQGEAVGSCAP